MLYRGAFSAGNPGGKGFFNPFKLDVKGIANTGVVRWGGRTLALYEVGALDVLEACSCALVRAPKIPGPART